MNRLVLLLVTLMVISTGCGEAKPDVEVNATGPLTVEEWREMDVLVKYELETFERLKEEDEKLKKKKNWDKFMRDVVVPERKKDIPTDY